MALQIPNPGKIESVEVVNNSDAPVPVAVAAGTNNIGDVDVLSVVPGTGAASLGKAEDAAHASGDVGVMVLAVRNDGGGVFGADGDYVPLSVQTDKLRVAVGDGAGGAQTLYVRAVGIQTDNNAPFNTYGLDANVFLLTYNGATFDRVRSINVLKTAQSTATASGSELVVWTPAAGKKFRLRHVYARASVAGRYEVRDGATVIAYFYLAANQWTQVLLLEDGGYLSAAANNTLRIRNQSGSAADLDVAAAGNEE